MIINWAKLLNISEFDDRDVPSIEVPLLLGSGETTIIVTKGIGYGVVWNGIFLAVNLNDKNPFVFDNTTVYLDTNNDLWLGILSES